MPPAEFEPAIPASERSRSTPQTARPLGSAVKKILRVILDINLASALFKQLRPSQTQNTAGVILSKPII